LLKKYDVSKTGTLSREEVRRMAEDFLIGEETQLIGGITDDDIDMIMRCSGDDTSTDIRAEDMPLAVAVMMAVRDDNANFHQLFQRHDKDNSGVLPADQLTNLLAEINDGIPPNAGDVAYILKQCEPRGREDPISEAQLKSAMACWYCLSMPMHEKIKEMFKAWDTHNTGVISLDELTAVMSQIGKEAVSDSEIQALFQSIDKNRNGTLEYEEFLEWVLGGGVKIGAGVDTTSGETINWSTDWSRST
jgi:Ca2+-binding EF-hand superfamily protein